jgi:hypothetical protein
MLTKLDSPAVVAGVDDSGRTRTDTPMMADWLGGWCHRVMQIGASPARS